MTPDWVANFVGIPYKPDGLTLSGCNCWGLVRLVYKSQCGIDLPTYIDKFDDLSATEQMMKETSSGTWLSAPSPKEFDVVHMTAYPIINGRRIRTQGHCGVMISPFRMLHVWEENPPCSVHVSTDNHRIRPRILGVYRHEALA